jgi:hypothetical protein
MKWLVTASLALGGALLISGCGGGSGPATAPFNPFGSDPSGGSSEPTGASNEGPSGPGTIADLCATDCVRVASACPSAAGSNCVASCEAESMAYPACTAQVQAYLACISTAAINCAGNGSLDASACAESRLALTACSNPGTTVSGAPAY